MSVPTAVGSEKYQLAVQKLLTFCPVVGSNSKIRIGWQGKLFVWEARNCCLLDSNDIFQFSWGLKKFIHVVPNFFINPTGAVNRKL